MRGRKRSLLHRALTFWIMVCGLVECSVDERVISSHYRGSLGMNNIKLFPHTSLWENPDTKQFPRYCIKWRYRNVHLKTWTSELVLSFVTSLLPYMIKMIHLLHQQMQWIHYRLVAFHICNGLPLKHDNQSCVKEIACTQLKAETNRVHTGADIRRICSDSFKKRSSR